MANRQVQIINLTRAAYLAERASLVDSFLSLARGLLGCPR